MQLQKLQRHIITTPPPTPSAQNPKMVFSDFYGDCVWKDQTDQNIKIPVSQSYKEVI